MKKDEKLEKLKKEFDIFNKKANKRELILGTIIFVLTAVNAGICLGYSLWLGIGLELLLTLVGNNQFVRESESNEKKREFLLKQIHELETKIREEKLLELEKNGEKVTNIIETTFVEEKKETNKQKSKIKTL